MSSELRRALVEAFGPYVRRRLGEHRIELGDDVEASINSGSVWLDRELRLLFELSPSQQRRGPLELFQDAMSFPTKVLTARGIESVARDAAVQAILPQDRYDLVPASPAEIGEMVWRLHTRWGVEKARAISGGSPPRKGET